MLNLFHTRIADIDAWASDEFVHFGRWAAAPRAAGIDRNAAAAPGAAPPAAPGSRDDLLNALMADLEGGRDFAERAAPQVQPADRGVIVAAGQESIALGVGQAFAGSSGSAEKVGIESHVNCLSWIVIFVYHD